MEKIFVVHNPRSETGLMAAFEKESDAHDFAQTETEAAVTAGNHIYYIVRQVELKRELFFHPCPHLEAAPAHSRDGIEFYYCPQCGERLD